MTKYGVLYDDDLLGWVILVVENGLEKVNIYIIG